MTRFEDYLIYYNNLDTGPFVIALGNMVKVYYDEGIDIFKDYITLPGVARRMLYSSSNIVNFHFLIQKTLIFIIPLNKIL